jgi:beta-glucanase (GH16 family)
MTRWIVPALLVTVVTACGSSKKSTGSTGSSTTGTGGETSSSTASSSGTGGATTSSSSSAGTGGGSASTGTGGSSTSGDAGADSGLPGWTLVWSDEFNGPDGTGIDTTKWAAQIGGTGWGNQELEYYTGDLANAQQSGGNLVITATTAGAAAQTCWYGQCTYTSARLQTMGLFSQEYGRFEARIKIPAGQGLWPAFWLLGNNINSASWPTCGEIDIMENIGNEPGTVHGSMHGPSPSGATNLTGSYTLPGSAAFSDDFHIFAVEWAAGVAKFYVDDTLYETETPADDPTGATWVYDQPFFILLNVAVGGNWPGSPNATTVFPQTMLVDYVRVYTAN